jgi:hypothetical protein
MTDQQINNSGDLGALEAFVLDNPELEELEGNLVQFNLFEAIGATRMEVRHSDFLVVSYLRCTAEKLSHSRIDHMWSVKPAAIAGVRACHLPFGPFWRNVRTGQQKL